MTLACFQVASSCILPSIMTAPVPSGMASRMRLANATSFGVRREHALGDVDLRGVQRPGAEAALQEGVAELRLAGRAVGEVAERTVERLEAVGEAGIDHLADGVVPQILLEEARAARRLSPASASTP